ncbi:MAG: helix-turn-helix domain-containing protein, partial [Eubacteriales bacterium]
DYAKNRIAHSAQNFTEIAEELGYSSAGYFSRVFRAREGVSPTEYSRMASKRV